MQRLQLPEHGQGPKLLPDSTTIVPAGIRMFSTGCGPGMEDPRSSGGNVFLSYGGITRWIHRGDRESSRTAITAVRNRTWFGCRKLTPHRAWRRTECSPPSEGERGRQPCPHAPRCLTATSGNRSAAVAPTTHHVIRESHLLQGSGSRPRTAGSTTPMTCARIPPSTPGPHGGSWTSTPPPPPRYIGSFAVTLPRDASFRRGTRPPLPATGKLRPAWRLPGRTAPPPGPPVLPPVGSAADPSVQKVCETPTRTAWLRKACTAILERVRSKL